MECDNTYEMAQRIKYYESILLDKAVDKLGGSYMFEEGEGPVVPAYPGYGTDPAPADYMIDMIEKTRGKVMMDAHAADDESIKVRLQPDDIFAGCIYFIIRALPEANKERKG